MEKYRIQGTASKLIQKNEERWSIESYYTTLEFAKMEYNFPYLYLETRGSKYLTFTYYLGSVQPQKLKLPIDKLIEIKN